MGNPLLALGAKGPYVKELHRLLVKKLTEIDPVGWELDGLEVKEKYDADTVDLVKAYQTEAHLPIDGMVGDMTWAALTGWEFFNAYDDQFDLVPSPDKFHCWAAATAMMRNESPNPNMTEPPGVTFERFKDGTTGGLANDHPNMEIFSKAHNMGMVREPAINCLVLCGLVRMFGRVMLNMKGVNSNLKAGGSGDSHFVVLAGVRGSGLAGGTTLRIYNPSPSHKEQRIVTTYQYWKNRFPHFTYQAFFRFSNGSHPIP